MILGSGLLTASGKTRLTLYTTKSGTFNPTIVASDTSGITWTWPDGSTYTGGTPSKVLAGGTQTITIAFDDPTLVTELNFQAQSMAGTWPLSSLAEFTGLTYLRAYGNTGLNVSGSLADAPAGLTQLQLNLGSTSSNITGSLADAPAGLTQLYLYSTSSNITGSLADAPAGLLYLNLYNTSSAITGGATAMAAVGIREIRCDSSSTTQANIDSILARLYADRAGFTYATPTLNVGGTNPDPTGTYADATPPTTGLEYAYKLVVDPDAEGFKKWAITY
ncbi:MAG: hypothetical protein KDE20_20430 [Caldilineaceae bacterium]|nr:hypothetical protein [Caldilineaceae bacterium]